MTIKQCFNFVWTSLVAATLVAAPAGYAKAQTENEPSIVVSIASLNEQIDDIKYMLRSAEMGMFGMMIDGAVDEYTPGLDRTKNIGLFLYITEDNPQEPGVLGFVPVTDFDALIGKLEESVDIDTDGDLTIIVAPTGEEVFVKNSNGYAFFSQSKDQLSDLPSRPDDALSKWAGEYNVGAKVFAQRIPAALRAQAIELIQQGFEMQMDQLEDQDPGLAEMQRKNFEMQMDQIKGLINDTEEVVIGMGADKEGENLFIDFQIVGTEGSKLARQCNAAADAGPARFGGFIMDNTVLNAVVSMKTLPEDAENATQMIDSLRGTLIEQLKDEAPLDDEKMERVEEIINEFLDGLNDMVKAGKSDAGVVATMELGNINLAAAMSAGSTEKFASAMNKLVTFIEDETANAPVEIEFKSNATTVNGVGMNMIKVNIPEEEDEPRMIFGESISIYYGASDDALYLCLGSSPVDLLKKALDNQGPSKLPAMQANLHLAPIMRFVANMENDDTAGQMAEMLEDSGKDRITVTAKMIKNGEHVRISMQDGVLKLIGLAGAQFGGMGGSDF